MGVDSFVMHGLAGTIMEAGYAAWILNPLSLFGLYPLSHPSGSLFTVAAFGSVSGLPAEWAIYAVDLMVSIVGALGAFLLGMEVRRHPGFGLLTALLFSLSPRFVGALLWQLPTRIMFTALIPLLLWAMLRSIRTGDHLRLFGVLSVVTFLMMTSHRLTILMMAVVAAFVGAHIVVFVLRVMRLTFPRGMLNLRVRSIAPALVVTAFVIAIASIVLSTDILESYEEGQILRGSGPAIEFANLGISLARSAGVLLPVIFVGIIAVARERNKGPRQYMLLGILILLAPTLFLRAYTGFFVLPFLSVFIGIGCFSVWNYFRARPLLRRSIVVATVAIILASNLVIVEYDLSVNTHMSNESYSQGLYARYNIEGTVLSNDGLLGARVHAISLSPYLPIGGATTVGQGPEVIVFAFYSTDYVLARVVSIPLSSLTVDSDSPFQLNGVDVRLDWAEGLSRWCDPLPEPFKNYRIRYVLENDAIAGRYVAFDNFYSSAFLACVHASRYSVYRDASVTIWLAYPQSGASA